MMTMTPAAADVIRDLTEAAHLPEAGGLRMQVSGPSMDSDRAGLAISLVEQPDLGDEGVDDAGVHVFLAPEAASLLGDKELDATIDEGQITFLLHEQR
jgi:Fe-S cluster assembly iron-binding protein IscA